MDIKGHKSNSKLSLLLDYLQLLGVGERAGEVVVRAEGHERGFGHMPSTWEESWSSLINQVISLCAGMF